MGAALMLAGAILGTLVLQRCPVWILVAGLLAACSLVTP